MTLAKRLPPSSPFILLISLLALTIPGCGEGKQTTPAEPAPQITEAAAAKVGSPLVEAAPTKAPSSEAAPTKAPSSEAAPTKAPSSETAPASDLKAAPPTAKEGIALVKPSDAKPLEAPKNPGVTTESCKTVCARMATLAFTAMPKDADPALIAQMKEAFGEPCFQGCLEEATKESNECIMAAKDLQALEACAP